MKFRTIIPTLAMGLLAACAGTPASSIAPPAPEGTCSIASNGTAALCNTHDGTIGLRLDNGTGAHITGAIIAQEDDFAGSGAQFEIDGDDTVGNGNEGTFAVQTTTNVDLLRDARLEMANPETPMSRFAAADTVLLSSGEVFFYDPSQGGVLAGTSHNDSYTIDRTTLGTPGDGVIESELDLHGAESDLQVTVTVAR